MRLIEADALKKDFDAFYGGVAHAAIAAEIIDKAPAVDCKKCVVKDWCDMVVENGKIIEMTEDELYCTYLDRDLAMCMDFNEYKTRMIAAGTKIVRCEHDRHYCNNSFPDGACDCVETHLRGNACD